jgi:TRAP-type mannitol/chloroaromatic compound transport system permease small subunit
MWLVLSDSIDNGDWVRETAEQYSTVRVQVRGKDAMYTWYYHISRHPSRAIELLHFCFFLLNFSFILITRDVALKTIR